MYPVIELSLGDYENSIDALIKIVDEQNLNSQNIIGKNLIINYIYFNCIAKASMVLKFFRQQC